MSHSVSQPCPATAVAGGSPGRLAKWLGLASLGLASPLSAARIVTDPTYDAWLDQLTHSDFYFTVSNLWVLVCTALVFLMHLGFASLEAGLTQRKNTVNILYKNVFVICSGLVLYALWGFRTMYPGVDWNGWLRFGWWIGVDPADYLDVMTQRYQETTWWVAFLFQAMFAATAATIVSGAVAERVKLGSFLLFTVLIVGLAYPVVGSWVWGGGWLARMDFKDFAGATVVHMFGGFAALACVLLLGPRLGKYPKGGGIKPIVGHSMPLAALGAFLLWFGWFGFNGGSVMAAEPELIGLVVTNTVLGGAMGGLVSMLVTVVVIKKPDLSMALNGCLAGLVSVTGTANAILPHEALIIGAIGGGLVVISVVLFDMIKVDDPVGAISVHGVCGFWGTLAVGIFGDGTFIWQLIGALTIGLVAFAFALVVFGLIKHTLGVRVSEEEETEGLDIGEHGQEAYQLAGGARPT